MIDDENEGYDGVMVLMMTIPVVMMIYRAVDDIHIMFTITIIIVVTT
jgi:hypothetical protein